MSNVLVKFTSFVSNALALVFSFMITLYQKFLTPLLGQNCRHYPSCSQYSKQSMVSHGLIKGLILSTARLLRCNPWSLGGFDPVPKEVKYSDPASFKLFGNYQTQLYKTHK